MLMRITDAIDNLPNDSLVKKRILSSQFQYSQELLGMRIRHNKTERQMAHLLNMPVDRYLKYEHATDLSINDKMYENILTILKKKLQD